MIRNRIAGVYAEALIRLAEEKGILEEIASDAKGWRDMIANQKEFWWTINTPDLSIEDRKKMLKELLDGKVHEYFLNTLMLLADKRRMSVANLVALEFLEKYDERRGVLRAKAKTAYPMNADQQEELRKALEEKTGREVRITNEIDEQLLGGVVVTIGEMQIDGSVARELELVKEELMERFKHGL